MRTQKTYTAIETDPPVYAYMQKKTVTSANDCSPAVTVSRHMSFYFVNRHAKSSLWKCSPGKRMTADPAPFALRTS
jgi:hypothetical protein